MRNFFTVYLLKLLFIKISNNLSFSLIILLVLAFFTFPSSLLFRLPVHNPNTQQDTIEQLNPCGPTHKGIQVAPL